MVKGNKYIAAEISRYEWLLDNLEKETLLCSDIGEQVVAEFAFKGTKKEVEHQLRERIAKLEKGFTNDDVDALMENESRLLKYLNDYRTDPYVIEIQEYLPFDPPRAHKASEAYHRRKATLHSRGECICYSNKCH